MKPCGLIDPWLIDLKPEDKTDLRYNRLSSLRNLKELFAKYGMTPAKFVDDEFIASIASGDQVYHRLEWGEVGRLLTSLHVMTPTQGLIAEIADSPCSALSPANGLFNRWLCTLGDHGNDDSSPHWRKPVVLYPHSRSENWPNQREARRELRYRINGSRATMARNLVCIDRYGEHSYFEPDLDPWRLGAIGTPVYTSSGRVTGEPAIRRLPRPVHVLPLNLSFSQIVEELQKKLDWSCRQADRVYYIPPGTWDPRVIGREEWRRGNIFPTETVDNGRRGPVDREGRVWLWDQQHNVHWDVQLQDGSHVNVSHGGKIL